MVDNSIPKEYYYFTNPNRKENKMPNQALIEQLSRLSNENLINVYNSMVQYQNLEPSILAAFATEFFRRNISPL